MMAQTEERSPLMLRVPVELHEQLRQIAKAGNTPLNTVAISALRDGITRPKAMAIKRARAAAEALSALGAA